MLRRERNGPVLPSLIPPYDGIVGGMTRRKTSLALDERTIPTARRHAQVAGVDTATWIEQAIDRYAAEQDVAVYEAWLAAMSEDNRADVAAFTEQGGEGW